MSKQTALEWLIEKVNSPEWQDCFIWHKEEIFQQAKAMEKEQIILANEDCSTNELGEFISGEQYYNETYGKA
jgi:hypothetical protein